MRYMLVVGGVLSLPVVAAATAADTGTGTGTKRRGIVAGDGKAVVADIERG